MASLGDLFFQRLLGQGDPAKDLQAAMLQQGATPGQPVATPAGAAGGPATGAPGAPAGAPGAAPDLAQLQQENDEVYKSPNDMLTLYTKLMERQQNVARFDRGIGLIMAGFAHPENRAAIINTLGGGGYGGGGGGGANGPVNFINSIMEMQQKQQEMQQMAAQRASLPLISQQTGIPVQQLDIMLSNGQLDEFLNTRNSPNAQLVQLADGTHMLIDKTTGKEIGTYGAPKPKQYTPMTGGDGSTVGFDPENPANSVIVPGTAKPKEPPKFQSVTLADGTVVPFNPEGGAYGQPFGPKEVPEDPNSVQEYNFYVNQETGAGRQPLSYNDWSLQKARAGASSVNNNINTGDVGLGKELTKSVAGKFPEEIDRARGAQALISSTENAKAALGRGVVAGDITSPTVQEGRKVLANVFGITDEDAINSDNFMATMQDVVAARLKSYGAGNSITDKDREYVQKSVGASLALDERSIFEILNIQQRVSRAEIAQYNQRVDAILSALPPDQREQLGALLPKQDLKASIPPEAIAELLKDPSSVREFNDTFGKDVGEYILKEMAGGQVR